MNKGALFSMIAATNVSRGTVKVGSSENDKEEHAIFVVFILALLVFVAPMFVRWDLPNAKYTIEMKLVTNEVITQTFILPSDAKFGVSSRQGSYLLVYSTNSNGMYFNLIGRGDIPIKYAVIDFKIIQP